MNLPSQNSTPNRLAMPGATVRRAAASRVPAALVALALPAIAPAVHAQSCDNQALPGGAACVSTVAAGQTVNGTTINNGGQQTVRGTAVGATVSSGGTQTLSSGGATVNTQLAGGRQVVSRGGVASGTVIGNDGLQTVFSAGSTVSTVVSSGGTQYVSAGGVATGTTVVSGGSFGVSRGGLASGSVVGTGGLMRIYSGGQANASVVTGGKQYVSAGGSAVGTVVSAGSQVVFTGGATTSTVVNGGIQLVSSGGLATGTQINAGGAQTVLLGGSAAQSTVAAGGNLTVDVGGNTAAGPVPAQTLAGVVLAGGTLTLDEAASDALTGNAALSADTLAMQGGTVAFAAPKGGGFKTLTIGQLSGSGQFVLNTNVGAGQSDRLVVAQGTGAYSLSVHDASTTAAAANARVQLVQAAGTSATFTLAGGGNGIDVGAYKFALQDDGGNYFLANTGHTSDIASIAQAAAATTPMLWYQQLETAFSYLGDLRNGAGDGGGLWVRAYDQRLKTNPGGTATDSTLYGAQVGRDWAIATHAGTVHVGATGGYAEANESFDGLGNGTARPWNIGAYAGIDTSSGLFADTVVRYLGFKQSLGVTTSGNQATGGYAQSGFAVSLDAGKRWQLGGRWWAEPRVEATWQHDGAVSYQTSLGTPIVLESKSVVFGGAGARVGASFAVGDLKLDPYVGVEAMHIFNAGLNDTIGGTALTAALPKTWINADLGVGATLTRHVRAWGAFGYGKGHDYSQPWSVTVGLRYVD